MLFPRWVLCLSQRASGSNDFCFTFSAAGDLFNPLLSSFLAAKKLELLGRGGSGPYPGITRKMLTFFFYFWTCMGEVKKQILFLSVHIHTHTHMHMRAHTCTHTQFLFSYSFYHHSHSPAVALLEEKSDILKDI